MLEIVIICIVVQLIINFIFILFPIFGAIISICVGTYLLCNNGMNIGAAIGLSILLDIITNLLMGLTSNIMSKTLFK